jgi:N-acetylglucosaminyl-diphospho-decaprenol L-rhamnosyltransferase
VDALAQRQVRDALRERVGSAMSLTVVVVTHNSHAYLTDCLDRLSGRDVVLVDNASDDGTPEFVAERYPDVRLVALSENVGFGRANNLAAESTGSDYLLLLNPDAWPVGDAIDELIAHADAYPDIGLAGPRLLNTTGTLQRSIHGVPTALWLGNPAIPGAPSPRRRRPLRKALYYMRWRLKRRPGEPSARGARVVLKSHYLKGAVLLVRREAWNAVGGFDSDFFLFAEEIDLCVRIRQAGWTVEYVPGTSFVHVLGGSTGHAWSTAYREQLRSHLRFVAKHEGRRRAEFSRHYLRVALRARAVRRRAEGRPFRDAADWLKRNDLEQLLDGG